MQRLVRVAAENSLCFVVLGEIDGAGGDFRRHAQPARVQAIDEARDGLVLEIEFLQLQIERRAQAAQAQIVDLESVELMAVDRDVAQAAVVPIVVLVDAHAYQMRHDIRQSVVVIALHPNDFYAALGVRQLANEAEKLPMIFGQACEVEVGKDVAQQNQAPEARLSEQASSFPRMARVRAEVQVRKDQRVVGMRIHDSIVAGDCYGVINSASILVHRVTSR